MPQQILETHLDTSKCTMLLKEKDGYLLVTEFESGITIDRRFKEREVAYFAFNLGKP